MKNILYFHISYRKNGIVNLTIVECKLRYSTTDFVLEYDNKSNHSGM